MESNIRLDLNENMLQILTNSSYNCIYHLNRYSLTIIKLCLKILYYNFEFIFLYINCDMELHSYRTNKRHFPTQFS